MVFLLRPVSAAVFAISVAESKEPLQQTVNLLLSDSSIVTVTFTTGTHNNTATATGEQQLVEEEEEEED